MKRLDVLMLFFAFVSMAFGQEQNLKELEADARRGDVMAQYDLGECYYNGDGVAQDFEKAVYWFRLAANRGLAVAQYELGTCYFAGAGVAQDQQVAVSWFQKAAEKDLRIAQYTLGVCYCNGTGIALDQETGIYWIRRSADLGFGIAQYVLASIFYNRGTAGDAGSYAEAVKYLEKARAKRDKDISGAAAFLLSKCYRFGRGVPQDVAKADSLQQEALEKGWDEAKTIEDLLKNLQ